MGVAPSFHVFNRSCCFYILCLFACLVLPLVLSFALILPKVYHYSYFSTFNSSNIRRKPANYTSRST